MTGSVLAAGVVLWRHTGGPASEPEIALVHRPKYDDWSLPKGKCEPGEHLAQTAVRETGEETGFTGPLSRWLGTFHYPVGGVDATMDKSVSYWAMRATGGQFTASAEVDQLIWLAPREAIQRLPRANDSEPVRALLSAELDTTSVLLVRHGDAGDRSDWAGPDELRPLVSRGRVQARRLAKVAPCFGVTTVWSADVTRCVQTIAPLARALGVEVNAMPALSEHGYARDPSAAIAEVRALAASGQPAAVCSQGGVIPSLLDELDEPATRRPRHYRSRKGSVWVLSFTAGRLVAADYLASLEAPEPQG